MWLVSMTGLLGVALSALGLDDPIPESHDSQPRPIASRQTLFSIPFHVDRTRDANSAAIEIQLYYSTDAGRRWQHYRSVHPSVGHFLFRAPGDGRFDFAIRTRDRMGRVFPQKVDRAGLTVVVDTAAPKLQLDANWKATDLVTATWRINDANLDIHSLALQFRTPGRSWQSVTIDRTGVNPKSTSWSSQVTLHPDNPNELVEIRAEVLDIAGNRSVSNARTNPSHRTARVEPPKRRAWRPTSQSQARDRQSTQSWQQSKALEVSPDSRIGEQFAPPTQPKTVARAGSLPPGVKPRMVNSRRFEMEYQIGSTNRADIERVDLWGTQDDGQTWSHFGTDHDNRSPFMATVKADGTYGFVLLVTSRQDARARTPQKGTAPDIWVVVDSKRPNVRILGVGKSQPNAPLLIRWEATDASPLPQSVAIYYREATGVQWFPITTTAPNTGKFEWDIERQLPKRIRLRVEVRDRAGNVGIAESLESVLMERWQPDAARIGNIQPLTQLVQPKRFILR